MERPKGIDSGEAMRWNKDVNRRRLEHHERRCTEDPMYRKAYEYQQEEERRMWEQMHKPFAEILAAEAQQRCVAGKTKDGHDVMVPISCVKIEKNGGVADLSDAIDSVEEITRKLDEQD